MVCPRCGYSQNPDGANYCEECGAELAPPSASPAGASEVAAPDAPERVSPDSPEAVESEVDPAQAETRALDTDQASATGWTCSCGASNPADEDFCSQCGEQRARRLPPLRAGQQFAGFEVVFRRDDGSYAVRGEQTAGREAVLVFASSTQAQDLLATLSLLGGANDTAAAAVPAVLGQGEDERGSWAVLLLPEGHWEPLLPGALGSLQDAQELLTELLGSAQRAAAGGRLLVLSPAVVLRDGAHALLPRPAAPMIPLRGPLLADPAWLAPEIRSGTAGAAPWPAAAFSVGAVVRAAAGAGLGFPSQWHAALAALRDDEPAHRPQSVEDVGLLLQPPGGERCVTKHAAAVLTDIGKHHPVNQDAGGVWTWRQPDGTPVTLAVVADGVSSGLHSEEAAAIAVQVVHKAIEPLAQGADFGTDAAEKALRQAGIEAQARVAALPSEDPDTASASTLVAVCIIGGRAAGIWCGDSRAYGVTPDGSKALTRDHSWVNLVVDRGLLTEDEARRDPRAHVITRWLGPSEPPREDPGLEGFRLTFLPGERLLVCSDGLYMYFQPPDADERELAALAFPGDGDLTGAVQRMVQTALERGGYDNITVVLVAFE